MYNKESGTDYDTFSGQRTRTTVFQHWYGHHKNKGREEDQRQLHARRTVEKEKQGVVEDLEYSQGGSTEQTVLVREYDCLMRLRSETR